jgi:hypothetical protein
VALQQEMARAQPVLLCRVSSATRESNNSRAAPPRGSRVTTGTTHVPLASFQPTPIQMFQLSPEPSSDERLPLMNAPL